jgi:DNA-binding transcriptional LysR family regulator
LSELEHAVLSDAFDPMTTARQFTLAMSDGGQIARLPRLTRILAKEMPHSQLRVVGIDTYMSLGGITGTEVHVAIIAVAEKSPGVRFTPLYKEDSVLVARRGHPRVGTQITKTQLGQLQHVDVQVTPGRGYRELARSYARLDIKRESQWSCRASSPRPRSLH